MSRTWLFVLTIVLMLAVGGVSKSLSGGLRIAVVLAALTVGVVLVGLLARSDGDPS